MYFVMTNCNPETEGGKPQVETLPNLIKEDDTTAISVKPIEVTDDKSEVTLEGMFLPVWASQTSEDEPVQEIEIEKGAWDRTPGFLIGRFRYKTDARAKVIFKASINGRDLDDEADNFGSGLPYASGQGYMEPTLLKWPSSARANKTGIWYVIRIDYAMITGIAESALGLLDWGSLKSKKTKELRIKFLPYKEARD
jgi:hypothetical protein